MALDLNFIIIFNLTKNQNQIKKKKILKVITNKKTSTQIRRMHQWQT